MAGKSLSPRSPPTLPTFDDDRQRSSFSFFILCTAIESSPGYGAEFWSQTVLQLSLTEPAIRYAVCSLSALHQRFRATHLNGRFPGESAIEYGKYSLEQYTHAVGHTKRLLALGSGGEKTLVIKGLVACILFVCYENLIGNFKTAQMHLQNGIRILAREASKRGTVPGPQVNSSSAIPNNVQRVFARLDLQAMAFADNQAPYPYQLHQTPPNLRFPPKAFNSTIDAMDYLIHNFCWIFRTAVLSEPQPVPTDQLDAASKVLKEWNSTFQRLLDSMSEENLQKVSYTISLLKMYHIVMTIIVATGIYGQECIHDAYLWGYEHVVDLGENLLPREIAKREDKQHVFSFEPGLIFPLFFTAIKCRYPQIRRRAIALLEAANHQEGSWESIAASRVAGFVMGIEEAGLPAGAGPDLITETGRVHLVMVSVKSDLRKVEIGCVRVSELDGSYYVTEGKVSY
ncbi:uncharacterized protein BP5553_09235 [Venustampulla echinocandica]|uniref:Uncharacterized protein n=1 Tax=Venustampulla echinocandica TaxID=2656787 RepID=A0A370TC50_9HELO|nr:uncharacterized protein BP5553_09235 [Venustampulla echinocandica]RDL31833.1 hypothetical protein BP5553_09235 [Venustampulla echinocandica]